MRERGNGNRAFKALLKAVPTRGGEPKHGTEDDKRYEDLPDCFAHELLDKLPKRSSIGAVLVDRLDVKADYELPTAAYEEILHILHVALGNARFPKTEAAAMKALGIQS
eukprot:jgi/Tetstr1/437690/TSEL_026346.t1